MSLRVNGEEVTVAELDAEYRRLEQVCRGRLPPEALAARQPELRAQARAFAVGRRLLLQEARRRELSVPDDQLAGGLRPLIAAAGGPAAWTAGVREKRINYREVCCRLTEALLVEQVIREITGPIPPPDADEIAFYYAQHAAELADGQAGPDRAGRPAAAPPPLADVREKICALLWNERRNQALAAFVEQLRAAALIEDGE